MSFHNCRLLTKKRVSDCNGVLVFAVAKDKPRILRVLLKHGLDPERTEHISRLCRGKAIHLAAGMGHLECLEAIIESGVDVNITDSCSRTPLHWAATSGHLKAVEVLIAHEAAINAVIESTDVKGGLVNNHNGWTPLHCASYAGEAQVVKALVDAGAALDHLTAAKETALHLACHGWAAEVVKVLLEAGAMVDVVNRSGYTPLHLSISYNHDQLVDRFLAAHARVDTINARGICPWREAIKQYQESEVIERERIIELMVDRRPISRQVLTMLRGVCDSFSSSMLADRVCRLAAKPPSLLEISSMTVRATLASPKMDVPCLPLPVLLKNLVLYYN